MFLVGVFFCCFGRCLIVLGEMEKFILVEVMVIKCFIYFVEVLNLLECVYNISSDFFECYDYWNFFEVCDYLNFFEVCSLFDCDNWLLF